MNKESFPSYIDLDLNNPTNLSMKNKIIPNELFKYTKVRHAKDLLYDNIIYLPQLSELNDPFEGYLLYDEDKIEDYYAKTKINEFMDYFENEVNDKNFDRNYYEDLGKLLLRFQSHEELFKMRNAITDGIYVICLSEHNDITSLWAHYADNHKGICIKYNIVNTKTKLLKNLCFPIEYVDDYDLTLDIKSTFNKNSMDLNLKIKPLLIKATDWSYEKEWRIIFDDSLISKYKENFHPYEPYIKFLKPQAVYMGIEISKKDERLIKNICKNKDIPLFKAIRKNNKYKFDFDEIII